MNIETQQVLLHFLERYESLLSTNVQDEINPFFDGFFLKQELIEILKFKLELNEEQVNNLDTKTSSELLNMIGDDVYILKYYLAKLKLTLLKDMPITSGMVWKTLEQLWQHTHYLASKDVQQWDGYDHSNYKAMSHKTGEIQYVYGMYDRGIAQEDVVSVTSPPNRFFETEELAKQALSESSHSEDDTYILHLLVVNP